MKEEVRILIVASCFALALAGVVVAQLLLILLTCWIAARFWKEVIKQYKKDHPDQRWFL